MKRILLATSAAALALAGSAAAATFFQTTWSGDVTVQGSVPAQCAIAFSNPTLSSGSASGSPNSYTVNFGNLDVNADGLADGNNVASVSVNLICNANALLEIDNANPPNGAESGLKNAAAAPSGFTNYVAYNLVLGPFNVNSLPLSAPGWLSTTATGPFNYSGTLSLTTLAGSSYLVAGNYQDTIYVKVTPTL